jgi:predicted ATPase
MASADLRSITNTFAGSYSMNDELGGTRATNNTNHAIYRRRDETAVLFATYAESGSVKMNLVHLLRDRVCDMTTRDQSPGYFVSGKYFQNAGTAQEPHSVITAAFSNLCDLVAQSDGFCEHRQQIVQETLRSDAQVLVKSISNLASFVGDVEEEVEACSMGKLKVAYKACLHAMASDKHPVVLFLDNIQWADGGSRILIPN